MKLEEEKKFEMKKQKEKEKKKNIFRSLSLRLAYTIQKNSYLPRWV